MRADPEVRSVAVTLATLLVTAMTYGQPRPQTPASRHHNNPAGGAWWPGWRHGCACERRWRAHAAHGAVDRPRSPGVGFRQRALGPGAVGRRWRGCPAGSRIRTGQFKPDVARVAVVDSGTLVPYHIETGAGTVTVVFGPANSSSLAQAYPPKAAARAHG